MYVFTVCSHEKRAAHTAAMEGWCQQDAGPSLTSSLTSLCVSVHADNFSRLCSQDPIQIRNRHWLVLTVFARSRLCTQNVLMISVADMACESLLGGQNCGDS